MNDPDMPRELTRSQCYHVLGVAFFGWLFAGLQIALFVLIHRPAMISNLSSGETAGGGATI